MCQAEETFQARETFRARESRREAPGWRRIRPMQRAGQARPGRSLPVCAASVSLTSWVTCRCSDSSDVRRQGGVRRALTARQ